MTTRIWLFAAAIISMFPGCGNAHNRELIPSLERLAEAGSSEALYHLGMAYQTGSGVSEDHAKAFDAFKKASELGDPLASYKLGCYFGGQEADIVPEDSEKALEYKLIAANAGYALAQQDVAAIYGRNGNLQEALGWLQKSADQGWTGGLQTLASVYNGAKGVKPDPAKTAAYFKLFLDRSEPNKKQQDWLANFEKKLSTEDRNRAAAIIKSYKPTPSPLTIKALSGQRAAHALVANMGKSE